MCVMCCDYNTEKEEQPVAQSSNQWANAHSRIAEGETTMVPQGDTLATTMFNVHIVSNLLAPIMSAFERERQRSRVERRRQRDASTPVTGA
jgi:hypothetical protein